MSGLLTLNEVRRIMQGGAAVDIEFCTYDEKRGTGGERKQYYGCTLLMAEPKLKTKKGNAAPLAGNNKKPQHLGNNTFNVQLPNGDVRKIHWLLIERLNNKKVVL